MTVDSFSQGVSRLSECIEGLQAEFISNPANAPKILSNALDSLHACIEDLQVAEKVIKRQNEECTKYAEERTDALTLSHELQIHQIELEMQNEELKRAKLEMNNALAKYTDLYDFAPIGLFTLDENRHILEVNVAGAELLGMKRSNLLNRRFELFISEKDRQSFVAFFESAFKTTVRRTCELSLLKNKGPEIHISLEGTAAEDISMNEKRFRIAITDITERKRMEEELSREKNSLQAVIENTHAHIAHLDPEFNFLKVNSAYVRGCGHSAEELIGHNHFELFPNAENEAIFGKVVQTGEAVMFSAKPFEYADQPERGVTYWDWILAPIKDSSGRVQSLVLSLTDVTNLKRMEEALRAARDEMEKRILERTAELSEAKENLETTNKKLQVEISEHERIERELIAAKDLVESALRAKSEFLAVMSHELRTPLNGIMGMASLLELESLSSEQSECVDVIKSSSESLLVIINDILNFTKMDSGKLSLKKKPFDLRNCVNDAVRLLYPKVEAKGLDIVCFIDRNVPEIIISDQMRLRQVLLNLLDNAIKFTDKGRIDVSVSGRNLETGRQEILFSIRDTGIGISKNDMLKLFEPFSQADMSASRKYGGTGLGLAISKGLVELLGGKIWAKSEPGRGSTFHFTVVIDQPHSMRADNSEPALKNNTLNECPKSCRVLLAEDNDVNRAVTLRMLKKLGYTADAVVSGREAIESLQRQHYDIVLMDVQMPDMDGLEATSEIRKLWPDNGPRIIALTAHALVGDRERCIDAGMNGYIAKPIEIDELADVLSRYQPSRNG